MVQAVFYEFVFCGRPGSNQAHFALEHIEELREFVQAGFADEFSDFRNARIIFELKHMTLHLVLCQQIFFAGIRIAVHGTEFINFKRSAVSANSGLRVNRRPAGFDFNRRHKKNRNDASKNQSHQCAENIHQSFDHQSGMCNDIAACGEHGKAGEFLNARVGHGFFQIRQHIMHSDAHLFKSGNNLAGIRMPVTQMQQDFIQHLRFCDIKQRVAVCNNLNAVELLADPVLINHGNGCEGIIPEISVRDFFCDFGQIIGGADDHDFAAVEGRAVAFHDKGFKPHPQQEGKRQRA